MATFRGILLHPSNIGFEAFWREYPRKIGKGAALKAWLKIKPDKELQNQMMVAIKNQIANNHFVGHDGINYIPNPSTWLNQWRWEDEVKGMVTNCDLLADEAWDELIGYMQRWGIDRRFEDSIAPALRSKTEEILKKIGGYYVVATASGLQRIKLYKEFKRLYDNPLG